MSVGGCGAELILGLATTDGQQVPSALGIAAGDNG